MIDYKKNKKDLQREKNDLESNKIMIYLKNKDKFKFSIGDILIQKIPSNPVHAYSHGEDLKWVTVKANKIYDIPKRFLYAFENELGIGYIKQLSIDGKSFVSRLICLANIDPRYTTFEVDPEYSDCMLLGNNFIEQINSTYNDIKNFRKNAIFHNKKILVKRKNIEKWANNLNIGDVFYAGWSHEQFCSSRWEIVKITKTPWDQLDNYERLLNPKMENKAIVYITAINRDNITKEFGLPELKRLKVSSQVPFNLKDKI